MTSVHLILWAAPLFFCLWCAILARLKGYSAACWLFSGGIVGILVLSRQEPATPLERLKVSQVNRLGLVLSAASVLIFFLLQDFL